MSESDFITTTEACDLLGVSKTVVKRMSDDGELETWKTPGGHRRLKRESVMQAVAKNNQGSVTSAKSKVLNVLLVDDDAFMHAVFNALVDSNGYPTELVSAYDGYEGLMKAGQGCFDIIFLDLNMPKLDGYAAAVALRQFENTRLSTIVMITGDRLVDIDRNRLPPDVVLMTKPLNSDVVERFMQYEYAIKFGMTKK